MHLYHLLGDFSGGSVVKNPPASPGDISLIPESGGFPGEGSDNPCLPGESQGQRVWLAKVHRVAKESDTT